MQCAKDRNRNPIRDISGFILIINKQTNFNSAEGESNIDMDDIR